MYRIEKNSYPKIICIENNSRKSFKYDIVKTKDSGKLYNIKNITSKEVRKPSVYIYVDTLENSFKDYIAITTEKELDFAREFYTISEII